MSDDGSTKTTCVSVGLCDADANGIDYQILVPTFDPSNTSMTFTVTQNDIYASVFYYKIFLGGITINSWDQTSLAFNFSNFNGVSLSLFVLDPEGEETQYNAVGDEVESIEFDLWSPYNSSWYYLTLNATYQGGDAAGSTGQFTFQITYEVDESITYDGPGYGDDDGDDDDSYYGHENWKRHNLKKFLWIPIAIAVPLVCMICCCCCVRRRMRRNRCAKTQTQDIPMQTSPTPMYFYVPPTSQPTSASVPQIPYFVTKPSQYSYVPMQPMVVPMTIPPTAPHSQQ